MHVNTVLLTLTAILIKCHFPGYITVYSIVTRRRIADSPTKLRFTLLAKRRSHQAALRLPVNAERAIYYRIVNASELIHAPKKYRDLKPAECIPRNTRFYRQDGRNGVLFSAWKPNPWISRFTPPPPLSGRFAARDLLL